MEYSHNQLLSNILLLLKMCDFSKTCFGNHLWDPKRVISLEVKCNKMQLMQSLNRLNAIKTNLMGFKKWSSFTGGLFIEVIATAGFIVYDFY